MQTCPEHCISLSAMYSTSKGVVLPSVEIHFRTSAQHLQKHFWLKLLSNENNHLLTCSRDLCNLSVSALVLVGLSWVKLMISVSEHATVFEQLCSFS